MTAAKITRRPVYLIAALLEALVTSNYHLAIVINRLLSAIFRIKSPR